MTNHPIKILVVEDEMIIGAKVAMYLSELGYEVTGILPRAEEVELHLKENSPDLALLDINLKGSMDGITLGEILHREHQVPVIFLTANSDDETFRRAKAAKPYAFLAKPFKKLDLQRALELTVSLIAGKLLSEQPQPQTLEGGLQVLADRIFVHDNGKLVKILFDDILYVEAERNYCRIVTKDRAHLLSMPMKSLESKLPAAIFQRIHRSYIVNLAQVDEVEEGTVVIAKKALPLSKSLREEFLLRIKTA